MKEYKLFCPKCKHNAGRFIRKYTELVLIIDSGEDGIRDEFIADIGDYSFTCKFCGANISDEDLIKGEEYKEN